jgi:prepilin-type N-terminal cleavage/methylation domain-containing protein
MHAPRSALLRRASAVHACAAFTLAELMVVIVIIGLMVGIITMSWQRVLPKEQFISEVRALAERIHGCRSNAISQNDELWMHYDLDNGRYWISIPYELGGGAAAYARFGADKTGASDSEADALKRTRLFERSLGKGIELASVTIGETIYTDGERFVPFSPIGTTAAHSIVLKQVATEALSTLEVQGLTGLISFHDGLWRREPANDNDFN